MSLPNNPFNLLVSGITYQLRNFFVENSNKILPVFVTTRLPNLVDFNSSDQHCTQG